MSKMLMRLFFLMMFLVLAPMWGIAQQSASSCPKPLEYENHNQIDPPPLSVRVVSGRVIAQDGMSVPNACLGLFTERDHHLIASIVADDDGNFRFRNVPSGRYRLVVRDEYGGFCTANTKINVVGWPRGGFRKRKQIIVHLRPSAIDTCSYADYK
jgi:hypothetical protein